VPTRQPIMMRPDVMGDSLPYSFALWHMSLSIRDDAGDFASGSMPQRTGKSWHNVTSTRNTTARSAKDGVSADGTWRQVSEEVCRHSLQSPRSGWPVILSISASRKTSGGRSRPRARNSAI
jgi:hypothetical protein